MDPRETSVEIPMTRVLLIDDEPRFCQAISETLRTLDCEVTTANCLAAAREALRDVEPDLILLDLILPDGNGLELLGELGEETTSLIVIVTGHPAIKTRIQGLVGPNVSYLTKPVDERAIVQLLEQHDLFGGSDSADSADVARHFGLLIGEAPAMHKVYAAIERFGPTDAAVLIAGESGTGKELVARSLHRVSGRRGRFIATNCGALAGELVASELFGHEKGSFTGATRRHAGVFERADGGTLFLDEISEMRPDLQTYLLRSLECGEIVPVGGEQGTKVDSRLLAATNRGLIDVRRDGALREDLYYRLSEFVITLPALRERGSDIDLLVGHFLDELNEHYGDERRAGDEFLEYCRSVPWPGNVRELRHAVHRAYVLADQGGELGADPGFDRLLEFDQERDGLQPGRSIRDVERELILKTLKHFDGDKKTAADTLGISLKTLYNRLNEYQESEPSSRSVSSADSA
jgi:DNA-binding NtrC family response regulator